MESDFSIFRSSAETTTSTSSPCLRQRTVCRGILSPSTSRPFVIEDGALTPPFPSESHDDDDSSAPLRLSPMRTFSDSATSPNRPALLRREVQLPDSFRATLSVPRIKRSYSDHELYQSTPANDDTEDEDEQPQEQQDKLNVSGTWARSPLKPLNLARRFLPLRNRFRRRPRDPNSPGARRRWLISSVHPLKLAWDVFVFILSMINAYATHTSIRDRQFGTRLNRFCELCFVIDILLNFVTEYKLGEGVVLKRPSRVWARYLTTWFVVDALSLFPGETIYLQPLIEMQNKRGFLQKYFFRTKGVIQFTRILRGRHFRWFGMAAKHTKALGYGGANWLFLLLVKYVPKYWMFLRHMKAVVVMRLFRQIHWIHKLWWHARTFVLRWRRRRLSLERKQLLQEQHEKAVMKRKKDDDYADDHDDFSFNDDDTYTVMTDTAADDSWSEAGDDDDDDEYLHRHHSQQQQQQVDWDRYLDDDDPF